MSLFCCTIINERIDNAPILIKSILVSGSAEFSLTSARPTLYSVIALKKLKLISIRFLLNTKKASYRVIRHTWGLRERPNGACTVIKT